MRPNRKAIPIAAALVFAAACVEKNPGTTPPLDAFPFPVAVIHADGGAGVPETLYVVSSNFDLRYNRGTILALDLSKFPAALAQVAQANGYEVPVSQLTDNTGARTDYVFIDSFAGLPAAYAPNAGDPSLRLFVPTRENAAVFAVNARGTTLSCLNPGGQDCVQIGANGASEGIRLVKSDEGLVALDPFAAVVVGNRVFVTHLRHAETSGGNTSSQAFIVRLDGDNPATAPLAFTPLTLGPAAHIAGLPSRVGPPLQPLQLVFTNATFTSAPALRSALIDPSTLAIVPPQPPEENTAPPNDTDFKLLENFGVPETRGVVLSTDQTRLFVTTRGSSNAATPPTSGPDALAIVNPVTRKVSELVPLPAGASFMTRLARPAGPDLVAISCTDSNVVALYDDAVGAVVALIPGILEPYGLASGPLPNNTTGKRLYVASFGGHRVWVIDVPDLAAPENAYVVGSIVGGAR